MDLYSPLSNQFSTGFGQRILGALSWCFVCIFKSRPRIGNCRTIIWATFSFCVHSTSTAYFGDLSRVYINGPIPQLLHGRHRALNLVLRFERLGKSGDCFGGSLARSRLGGRGMYSRPIEQVGSVCVRLYVIEFLSI